MDTKALLEFRKQKDEFFASFESPLEYQDRSSFQGLAYFDPDPSLSFTAALEPGDDAEIEIQTTDGKTRVYRRVGTVALDVNGETVRLVAYDTGHPGYFIPFRDATSGKETYGGGRYLDIDPDLDGMLTVDFNLAYNPYCVYNDGYSCPLPPPDNWLQVPIEAGERDFERA